MPDRRPQLPPRRLSMPRGLSATALATAALAVALLALPLAAQDGSGVPQLDPTDLDHWNSVRSGRLTPDGQLLPTCGVVMVWTKH